MDLAPMFEGIPFSPIATLAANIGASDTVIEVDNITAFPSAPNYATIGTDESAETVQYNAVAGNLLSGCVRGVEGTARTWLAGEVIARNFTAEDYKRLKRNIEILDSRPSIFAMHIDNNGHLILTIGEGRETPLRVDERGHLMMKVI